MLFVYDSCLLFLKGVVLVRVVSVCCLLNVLVCYLLVLLFLLLLLVLSSFVFLSSFVAVVVVDCFRCGSSCHRCVMIVCCCLCCCLCCC